MELFIVLLIVIAANACEQKPFTMVGFERVISLSIPVGVSLAGFERGGNLSTGVHDNLYTRSIVLIDEDDFIGLRRGFILVI